VSHGWIHTKTDKSVARPTDPLPATNHAKSESIVQFNSHRSLIIVPVYYKGDKAGCSNYGGISVLSPIGVTWGGKGGVWPSTIFFYHRIVFFLPTVLKSDE